MAAENEGQERIRRPPAQRAAAPPQLQLPWGFGWDEGDDAAA